LNEIWARQPPYIEIALNNLPKVKNEYNNPYGGDVLSQEDSVYANRQLYANIHKMKMNRRSQEQYAALPHQICFDNRRPIIIESTPIRLKKLIESCWNSIPRRRPSICEVVRELRRVISLVEGNVKEEELLKEDEARKKENKSLEKEKEDDKEGKCNSFDKHYYNNEWLDKSPADKEEEERLINSSRGLAYLVGWNGFENVGSINTGDIDEN
jgi:hypothetical protein